MMHYLEIALIAQIFITAYTYLGYAAIWSVKKIYHRSEPQPINDNEILPNVTVIIAAYNEASCIHGRLTNLLALDYPPDKLKIRIESDGSTDATVELALKAAAGDHRIIVAEHKRRRGKVSVLNEACEKAEGEILIFSDANVIFEPDALKSLVSRFSDSRVACVCGKLCFNTSEAGAHASAEGLYWQLESWLKQQEGEHGILLGANGAIYAVRRNLWKPCPSDTVTEDFYIPMRFLMEGYKVVFEPSAVAHEAVPQKLIDEFERRIRIGAGDFQAFSRCFPLLHPRHGLAAWAFLSRKVLRWFSPFVLFLSVVLAISLTLMGSQFGTIVLYAWGGLLLAAFFGASAKVHYGILSKPLGASAHFIGMNLALFLGFFRWLFGAQKVTWKRTTR